MGNTADGQVNESGNPSVVDPGPLSTDADAYVESLRAGREPAAAAGDGETDESGADEAAGDESAADAADEAAAEGDESDGDEAAGDDKADEQVQDEQAEPEQRQDATPAKKPEGASKVRAEMQARIDHATKETVAERTARIALETENARLKADLAKATAPKPKSVDELRAEANDPEPLQSAIGAEGGPKDYEDWNRQHNRWSSRETRREEIAQEQAAAAEAAAAVPAKPAAPAASVTKQAVLDSVHAVRAKDPAKFDAAMAASKSVFTPAMDLAIEELDTTDPTLQGRIWLHIAENEAESKRIAQLPVTKQVKAIQDLATSLTTAKSGSSSTTETPTRRVPVLRPSTGRSSAPAAPLSQIQNADDYVARKRQLERTQNTGRRRG